MREDEEKMEQEKEKGGLSFRDLYEGEGSLPNLYFFKSWCYVKITDTLNLYFLGKSAKCTKWSHLFHGLLDNEPLMA